MGETIKNRFVPATSNKADRNDEWRETERQRNANAIVHTESVCDQ